MAKVGRPARISRAAIAEAANEIGLSDLTLRAVADHLGVSIASLYHHVDNKDDLLRLAAEHAAARTPIPRDEGQHWAVWLLEWAFYNRDAFVAEPALLGQYLDGAISTDVMADNLDAILAPMVRQGFGAAEAQAAYQGVTSCALGSAVNAIREQRAVAAGRPEAVAFQKLLDDRSDEDLPHLRALLAEIRLTPLDSFEARVTTVLAGIAVRRGDDWQEIVTKVDRLLTAHG
jgi:AcrR family transcriptional regulator